MELPYEYAPRDGGHAPVVLLPGLFAAGWMWDETCAHLAQHGWGVVRVRDALAARPETAAGIEALREALQAVLERLELRRVNLCGNSLGALVALDFTTHHPERVASAVLSGVPGLSPDVNIGTGLPRDVRREHLVELARRLFHDPARATPVMIDRTQALLSERRHVANVLRGLRAACDYPTADALSRLTCRTLLVWGANDGVTPAAPWKRIARTVPRCTFRTVPRCGHSPMVERPDEFNRLLLRFLAGAEEP
jgi:pimeloyl-ACP methyl ester carboxylesterase